MFKFKKDKSIKPELRAIFVIILIAAFLSALLLYFNKDWLKWRGDGSREESDARKILNSNKGAYQAAEKWKEEPLKPISEEDHYLGDLNAKVKIIIYSDFECPFCASFAENIKILREEFLDKTVVAFRHFPLTTIHFNALDAAMASECAAEQGKFWEMHDKIFADNKGNNMAIAELKNDAAKIGLDKEKFNQCLGSEKYKEKVISQISQAKKEGVTGAPTAFINNELIAGAYPLDDFIDSSGKKREGLRNIILRQFNSRI